ncbi:uncharacterized protein At4g14342-like isoform X2 [Asparagus officinalis]|uniref:uncharacterized protein At4g14342-like isoform X2 n=1 Tax=Asparagus officinalis TaxID=4686 RepID=UPI00098E318A|nr:uncharacterized protein At4g14342-like isoform X2 [Asparagus officinalis]
MQASDRFNINSQLEHLQAKYVGTGHADMSRFDWAVNIQRDSYASYVGHYPLLAYFAVAENESIGREHYNFMQKMLLPCGLPPEREEDQEYRVILQGGFLHTLDKTVSASAAVQSNSARKCCCPVVFHQREKKIRYWRSSSRAIIPFILSSSLPLYETKCLHISISKLDALQCEL